MTNIFAKSLVALHLVLSLMALTWALMVFMDVTDWGWKEPRQDLGQSVASEYEKSTGMFKRAVRARDAAWPAVTPARADRAEAQNYFPKNHLYYLAELRRLKESPDEKIEVKGFKGPGLPLEPAGKPKVGRPVLGELVPGVVKSQVSYRKDRAELLTQIDAVEKQVRDLVEKTKKIDFQLTGKDDAGAEVQPGLYALVDAEYRTQAAAKFEKEYLSPRWAQSLEEARLYTLRRTGLEKSLRRLQDAMKKRGLGAGE